MPPPAPLKDRPLPPIPSKRSSLLPGAPVPGRIRNNHKHSRSHPSSLSELSPSPQHRHRRPYSYTSVGMMNLLATHQTEHSATTSIEELPHKRVCLPLRRLYFLTKTHQHSPPPPPPEEPKALKMYSNNWRRSTSIKPSSVRHGHHHHGHSASLSDIYPRTNRSAFDPYLGDQSDFGELERPRRHFAYEHHRHRRSNSNTSGIDYNDSSDSSISAVSRSSWNNNNVYMNRPGTDSLSGSSASNNSSTPLNNGGSYAYPNANGNGSYSTSRNTVYTYPLTTPNPLSALFGGTGAGFRSSPNPNSSIPSTTSIHDLLLATCRNRAPILRVFVPTQHLSSTSIQACERQLQESGLWEHLSTGDVVCNFGYIPVDDEETQEETHRSDGGISGGLVRRASLVYPLPSSYNDFFNNNNTTTTSNTVVRNAANNNKIERKKWLIFDGISLVPYTPPDLLPLSNPLHLPSPFYYHHIMPAFSNPQFIITRFPPVLRPGSSKPSSPTSPTSRAHARTNSHPFPSSFDTAAFATPSPTLALLPTASQTRSPNSPSGLALVRSYAWTARVVRRRLPEEREIGDGWFGEWVVECEGTKEGRRMLVDALRGKVMDRRVCEVVRERSGGGRLWFRCVFQFYSSGFMAL